MANTFLLTLATQKPKTQVGGGIFRVRGTVTVVGDGSATTAAGETLKYRSLTQGPDIGVTDTATVIHIKKALQLPTTITHIQSLGLLRTASAGAAAVAFAWEIDPTTGKLLIFGSSATAGELRQTATVNLTAGTYTAQFMAEGW
jgi:hypothetical protein